mmetsp:Transcript_35226/g.42416  ORF Transcript_35226/g.42416 Transcript_35226/m.42416 type:complete len:170 (+) Transcript_35226:3-512(+)
MHIDGIGFHASAGRSHRLADVSKQPLDPKGKLFRPSDAPSTVRLHDKIQATAGVRDSIHQYQVDLAHGVADGFIRSPMANQLKLGNRIHRLGGQGKIVTGPTMRQNVGRGMGSVNGAFTDRSHHMTTRGDGDSSLHLTGLASQAVKPEPSWLVGPDHQSSGDLDQWNKA